MAALWKWREPRFEPAPAGRRAASTRGTPAPVGASLHRSGTGPAPVGTGQRAGKLLSTRAAGVGDGGSPPLGWWTAIVGTPGSRYHWIPAMGSSGWRASAANRTARGIHILIIER
jgi:hypothetical protein